MTDLEVHRFPEDHTSDARRFTVIVPEDVTTFCGNVAVPAGAYEAEEMRDGPEGTVVVWSEQHYACPIRVGITAQDWHFPGEAPRPIPEHDCLDYLRTPVVGDEVYCSVCRAVFT